MSNTDKMLERVRALLAKADSTTFPEEAETFRQKADELMTKFAIEQWMVDQAQAGVGARAKPEKVQLDFSWWRASSRSDELWNMFHDVASHCRVVIAVRGWGDGGYSKIPVIGLKSDIQYFDLLFTHLMLQMGKQLEPSVDPSEGLGVNVYRLRQAGQPWPRITEQVFRAELVRLTAGELKKLNDLRAHSWNDDEQQFEVPEEVSWEDLRRYPSIWQNVKNRLANANRSYVKEHGLQEERNYVKPQVYQRSFAYGFVDEVGRRLREMDRRNRAAYDAEHESGSMALVVRDIYDQALALYEELFPKPEPVAGSGKARKSRAVTRSVRMSGKGLEAGRDAGAKADLSGKPGKGIGNQKEINR